jgi:hypothetical protein
MWLLRFRLMPVRQSKTGGVQRFSMRFSFSAAATRAASHWASDSCAFIERLETLVSMTG